MIFLSYASEDVRVAMQLADRLLADKQDVWMDRKRLRPGQEWEPLIWRAAAKADTFCVLLSSKSVSKRGFIRKEMRYALDKWKEKLPEDVFLIPCRIEPVEPPFELAHLQYVDLFENDGYNTLLAALESANPRDPIYKKHIRSSVLEYVDVNIELPLFYGAEYRALNEAIESIAARQTANAQKLNEKNEFSNLRNSVDVNFSAWTPSSKIVSVLFAFDWYASGAAHPSHGFQSLNFDLATESMLSASDLFIENEKCLKIIAAAVQFDLNRQLALGSWYGNDDEIGQLDSWIQQGAAPVWSNFDVFNIRESGIAFHFAPYIVGCYAWGPRSVLLQWADLRDLLSSRILALLDRAPEVPDGIIVS